MIKKGVLKYPSWVKYIFHLHNLWPKTSGKNYQSNCGLNKKYVIASMLCNVERNDKKKQSVNYLLIYALISYHFLMYPVDHQL